jgi:sec-independent protein translocase protein TatA
MFGLGMPELIIILLIAVVIFGAGKLPQVGEGLGKAIRGFRKSVSEPESDSDGNHASRNKDNPSKDH